MDELSIATMITDEILQDENELISEKPEHRLIKYPNSRRGCQHTIDREGHEDIKSRTFTTRKGKDGKLTNVILADDTGEIRTVFWTENIKFLKKFSEGDVIRIRDVNVKGGFRGRKEAHLMPRSTVEVLDPQIS